MSMNTSHDAKRNIYVMGIDYVRILLGLVYLINGLNWFFKIIGPYPSISDFVLYLPPDDLVGALIDKSFLFHIGKGVEVIAGIMLLTNRFVPLALVASMSVTAMVFFIDVFKPEMKLRSTLMGVGTFTMNVTLLLAYYQYVRPVMNWKASPTTDPANHPTEQGDAVAHGVGILAKLAMPVLTLLSALMGTAQVIWLLVLVAQYASDPKGLHEIKDLTPRSEAVQTAG